MELPAGVGGDRPPSKHRMPEDDALCLWFPWDPPERRWISTDGLVVLLDLVTDHLLCEDHWRATGGADGGIWPSNEAEHGFAQRSA